MNNIIDRIILSNYSEISCNHVSERLMAVTLNYILYISFLSFLSVRCFVMFRTFDNEQRSVVWESGLWHARRAAAVNVDNGEFTKCRRRKFRRPFRGPRCLMTRIIYNFNNRGKRRCAGTLAGPHRLCSFHPYVTTICLSNGANE